MSAMTIDSATKPISTPWPRSAKPRPSAAWIAGESAVTGSRKTSRIGWPPSHGRNADEPDAADDRQDGEHLQHAHHAGRRLLHVLGDLGARLAVEGQEPRPPHVEGRAAGGERAEPPARASPGTSRFCVVNAFQRISSLDQKPARKGMGAAVMARHAMK